MVGPSFSAAEVLEVIEAVINKYLELRATGDVLIDQLVSMSRTGFDVAVLRDGLDASAVQRQLDRFPAFYQGSAIDTKPFFAKKAA